VRRHHGIEGISAGAQGVRRRFQGRRVTRRDRAEYRFFHAVSGISQGVEQAYVAERVPPYYSASHCARMEVVSTIRRKEGGVREQDYADWAGFGKGGVSCGVLRRARQGGETAGARA
jgi:hypothetical protein